MRIAGRGAQAVLASRAMVAEVAAEWTAHLGVRRMSQRRDVLTALREITDPSQDATGV